MEHADAVVVNLSIRKKGTPVNCFQIQSCKILRLIAEYRDVGNGQAVFVQQGSDQILAIPYFPGTAKGFVPSRPHAVIDGLIDLT